ncbi:MAG: hypothetical protein HYT80_09970 [Euryarchaeota archaeon]|nr:hypothetical protein [Euryarchaeota archaeon]
MDLHPFAHPMGPDRAFEVPNLSAAKVEDRRPVSSGTIEWAWWGNYTLERTARDSCRS